MRLKQRHGLLKLDFHYFSIIKRCWSINQEWHKYSWSISGAVWWNGLLFEVSSCLLNLQHLCTLVLIRLYLVPSAVLHVAELPVCDISRVNRVCEQSTSQLLLWSLGSDQLRHSLLSPFIVIPLRVFGQETWGRKAPWDPGRSPRSRWHREEQVQISQGTGLVG